jgi:chitin disaccharide deacetylase
MTAPRIQALLRRLPQGTSEIYFHPASGRDDTLDRLMPGYRHADELAALIDPATRDALDGRGVCWEDLRPA